MIRVQRWKARTNALVLTGPAVMALIHDAVARGGSLLMPAAAMRASAVPAAPRPHIAHGLAEGSPVHYYLGPR